MVKIIFTFAAFIIIAGLAEAGHVVGHIDGYYRRDGTYVSPHYRSRRIQIRTTITDIRVTTIHTPGKQLQGIQTPTWRTTAETKARSRRTTTRTTAIVGSGPLRPKPGLLWPGWVGNIYGLDG